MRSLPTDFVKLTLSLIATASMVVMAATVTACEGQTTEPRDPEATTSGPASSSRYAPSAAASATGTGSAAPASPHAGTYKGTFKSTRADVTVPEGITYPTWTDDPGGFEGDNQITIEVANDGLVTGKVTGALGTLQVSGLVDDEGFSLGLSPENASDPDGMTGVCSGTLKKGSGTCRLRMSNATGTVVRQAEVALKTATTAK